MQNKILFGTAGIPHSAERRSSECGIVAVKENNLDAMEVEFVRGVRLNLQKAAILKMTSNKHNIKLSCHAPYYINLNSDEEEKITASRKRIIDSAIALNAAGGKNVVFHSGFYLKNTIEESINNTISNLNIVREELDRNEMRHIILRPELTGKHSQIGSEKDLLSICSNVERTLPCIDFSHFLARYNGKKEFCELFEFLHNNIPEFFKNAHCHLSGIEFGLKGEKNHLDLEDSNVNYKIIINLMIKYKMNGTVICESPSLEKDAALMKRYYEEAVRSE